jgi:hypothetical protein
MLLGMKRILPFILAGSLLAFAIHAENAVPPENPGDPFVKKGGDAAAKANGEDETWKQCVITYEVYALDRDEAAALLESERGSAARYRHLLELAKAGKARLEMLESLTTKSGQRAIIESIDEVRYPVEFNPPENAKGIATPTAWETRNVGDTFEVEPVIMPDGKTCYLNIVPQRVSLAAFRDLPELPGTLLTSQPIFNTQKITTSTSVVDGEPHYLGTMSPQTPQGIAQGGAPSEIWLAFLHVSLQGPPPKKAAPSKARTPDPADGNEGPPPSSVELQYSCYSLDRATAREILIAPASMTAQWEAMKKLVAEKKAQLEHISTVKTKSGQRAVTEEIREVRYGTEYSPAHRLGSSETTQRLVTNHSGENKADGTPKADATSTETVTTTRTDANSEIIPAQTAAFETRNVGVTVEVEPIVGPDGLTVDTNNAISSVKLIGNLKVTGIATQYPPQPLFEAAKVTTSVSLQAGLPVLVGTLNPPAANGVNERADGGRTYLLFIRATVGEP